MTGRIALHLGTWALLAVAVVAFFTGAPDNAVHLFGLAAAACALTLAVAYDREPHA